MEAKSKRYNDLCNEGGEGYNPCDDIRDACERASMERFYAANPDMLLREQIKDKIKKAELNLYSANYMQDAERVNICEAQIKLLTEQLDQSRGS